MAQCVERADKRPANETADDVIDIDDVQPKKLKQGRLPFQPLDCKVLTPSTAGLNSKKRKLSGQDSPNSKAKLAKHTTSDINHSTEKQKQIITDNDNEVSSSSEAENLPGSSGKPKSGKNNILERFIRRESLQEEITSTNDVIDLTDSQGKSVEPDENSPVKVKSPVKSAKKSQNKPKETDTSKKDKSEDGFARKLVFADDKNKEASNPPEVETQPSKDNVELTEEDLKAENAKVTEEENSVVIDDESENGENDVSMLEEESEDDATTPDKQEGKKISACTPSAGKEARSCRTPRTPASLNTSCSSVDSATPNSTKKRGQASTGKQAERAALRQKVKEEKEKQRQEAKEKREKERMEKKLKKEEEKAEKNRQKQEEKEKREKEKLQKKEQLEKEKQEKQLRREEDKMKKQEVLNAKLEEKKKKEEEKRQKEEEKLREIEEKEKQKQKRKEAFESFFIKPTGVTTTKIQKTADSLFIPFEVKKDMSLAPANRRSLTDDEKDHLAKALSGQVGMTYVKSQKKGVVKPVRTGRKLRTKKEAEQEVELMVHDSETVKKVMHAVKLLQFHTDYRPPYYGTWRKPVKHISPRNPWKKDEDIFDYEVDSDDEWEEEEPGESLSDFNDEDEDVEGGEEEDDDGWMVPHGYLSEDEGCDDDEEVTPEVLKARQRAKAQAWEAELKAKKQVAPPVHLGCYWQDVTCFCQEDLDILKQFEMVCLRTLPLDTLISCPSVPDAQGDKFQEKSNGGATPSTKGFRKKAVPDEAMPDLIRLLHGNSFGIKKLIREFLLYWKRRTSDPNVSLNESRVDEEEPMDTSCADTSIAADPPQEALVTDEEQKSTVAEDSDPNEANSATSEQKPAVGETKEDNAAADEADDHFCISKRQLEMKIMAIAAREKRPGNSKKCWYVNEEILQQYNMTDLPAENSWEYISCDMTKKTPNKSSEKVSKTPSKSTEKKASKTPSKSVEKKASKESGKKTPVVDNTGAEVAEEDNVDKDTLVTEKAKKEKVLKTPKDQPTIMGFTRKIPQGKSEKDTDNSGPEAGKPSMQKVEARDTDNDIVTDTKSEQPSVLGFVRKASSKELTSSTEDKSKGHNESMETDCIILD